MVFGQDGIVKEEEHSDILDRPVCLFAHNGKALAAMKSFSDKG